MTSSLAESFHCLGTILDILLLLWLLHLHKPLPRLQQQILEAASPKAASRTQTISHPHPPLLHHFHLVPRHQRWLRNFHSRSQCCLRLRPTARWTGHTTPMSQDIVSVTRFLTEKWSAVIILIVQLSGFTTAVWGSQKLQKESGTVHSVQQP